MTHGLIPGHQLRLRIDPAIECQIYRTIPHDMMREYPREAATSIARALDELEAAPRAS